MYVFQGATTVTKQVDGHIRGLTRAGINGSILKSLRIPLPSLEEQRQILCRIESLFNRLTSFETAINKSFVPLLALESSILSKAFRGELNSRGQSCKPATSLLENTL